MQACNIQKVEETEVEAEGEKGGVDVPIQYDQYDVPIEEGAETEDDSDTNSSTDARTSILGMSWLVAWHRERSMTQSCHMQYALRLGYCRAYRVVPGVGMASALPALYKRR